MNSNNTKQPSKFTRFLRNNAALLLLIFCVLAITAVVLAVTLSKNEPVVPDDPVAGKPEEDKPSDADKPNQPTTQKVNVYFASPLQYTGVGMEYTFGPDNIMVYSQTLEHWLTHKAVDLKAEAGTAVCAMFDGTVTKATQSYGTGYYVTIDHGDNVVATYQSLADLIVKEGDVVKKGDVIGYVSDSAEYEFMDGPHLHLEVTVNKEYVDPMPYVNGEKYRTVEVAV